MLNANDVTQVLPSVTGKCLGDVLADRFKLVKLLGNGANGSVFLARDLHLHCDIALKLLHNTLMQSPETIDAVRQEILLARGITHPNVIRVHDFYLTQDCAFYTMDFIDGVNLAQYRLPQTADAQMLAEQIGAQLIDAVAAIHHQGIVHCDITPHNILLDKHNKLYLLDLGLASALTSLSHQCCTPIYSAPEVLQAASHSQLSDYYAVAVTLYQLLTNSLPFDQADLGEQLAAKLQQKPALHYIDKHFPRWQQFFRCNLAAYPQQRSQTSNALKQLWLMDVEQNNNLKPAKTRILALMVVALAIVLSFWFSFDKPTTQSDSAEYVQAIPLALAILPSDAVIENSQQRAVVTLVQRLLYDQLRSKNVRLIPLERVQTTLQHLGFELPLTDRQFKDVANLLGADVLLSSQVTLLANNVEFATALTDMRQSLSPQLWSARQSSALNEVSAGIATHVNAMLSELKTKPIPGVSDAREMPDQAQLLYSQIMLAQANNDDKQVVSLLEQFQQRFPSLAIGFLLAAEWYQQQQNWLLAESFYAQAVLKSAPGSYDYMLSNARLAALQQQFVLADTHYQQLLQAKPFDTQLTLEYVGFLSQQNRYLDASKQLQQLALIDKTNPEIFLQLGKLAIRTGEINRAVDDYLLQAQVLYKRLKNPAGLADTLNAVGVAMQRLGKFSEAAPYYQEALQFFKQVNDIAGMAKASTNLGFMQFVGGDALQARQTLKMAMQFYRQVNDQYGQASTFDNLGMLEEEQGDYGQAQRYFAEAFSIRTQLDDSWELTESLSNLGYIYFVLSEFEQSLVYLKQAEQTAVENNDALSLIKVRQSLAQLKLQQGEWGQAFRLFKATSDDAKALDLTEDQLIAEAFLARLSGLQGNFLLAETQLTAFTKQASEEQDPRAAVEFTLWLTELYQQSAQYDKAQSKLALLRDGSVGVLNNEQHQTLQLLVIHQLIADGQVTAALHQLQQLQQMLRDHPLPRLNLKAFIAAQQINFMQAKPMEVLPERFEALLRHHVPEHLLWLELQALYAAEQGDVALVSQLLNQALPLLRRATSYWRNFVFEYLQHVVSSDDRAANSLKISNTAEFERLLKRIPEAYQQQIMQRENKTSTPGYAK